jgi:hypothetical protein
MGDFDPFRARYPYLYPNLRGLEAVLNPDYTTAAEIAARSNQHKPTDAAQLGREANSLLRQGLTTRDVADAFRMSVPQVQALMEAAA